MERQSIIELGRDMHQNVSSLPVIEKGLYHGYRKQEITGKWTYVTGYSEYDTKSEKSVHYTWAKALIELGHEVGQLISDGAVGFYVFSKFV
jgi:hypothetical protein